MEPITFSLNNDERWDAVIKSRESYIMPVSGGLEIVTKNSIDDSGKTVAMVTFTIKLPNGDNLRVWSVTLVEMIVEAGDILRVAHKIK